MAKTDVTLPTEQKVDLLTPNGQSPFVKAAKLSKRRKILLWGPPGSGKTWNGLQFPKPVVIDMEGGCDLYGEEFGFDVLRAATSDDVHKAVAWLLRSEHQYRTLVLDPVSVYASASQTKWSDIFMRRKKGSKGYKHEYYDFQPRDWMTMNAEQDELWRMLTALDMTVVVTARSKTRYKDGSFMVAEGETFDAPRRLAYIFDTILHLYVDGRGHYMALCEKDRSNSLPHEEFEMSYETLEKAFGKKELNRKPKPIEYATAEQIQAISDGIKRLGLSTEVVNARLAAYGADSLDSLTKENAALIIEKLNANGGNGNAKTAEG